MSNPSEIVRALDDLMYRERRVLELRYGLLDHKRRSLNEIGRRYNIPKSEVRDIERKALAKLVAKGVRL